MLEQIEIASKSYFVAFSEEEANAEAILKIKENVWSFEAGFLDQYSCLSKLAIIELQKSFSKFNNELLFSIQYFDDFVRDVIEINGRGLFLSISSDTELTLAQLERQLNADDRLKLTDWLIEKLAHKGKTLINKDKIFFYLN